MYMYKALTCYAATRYGGFFLWGSPPLGPHASGTQALLAVWKMKADTYHWGAPSSKAPMVVGGGPNSDASPFGAWGAHAASSESQDLAGMQQRTEQHVQQVKETERRILQKVEETRQIGASTLTQLHMQHEQLDRVATAQHEIDGNLATTDRLLRGMESWRGAFVNTVSGWFDSSADSTAPPPAAGRERAGGGGGGGGGGASRAPAASVWPPQQAAAAELDSVGQISQVVSDLRTQAELINQELRGQSGQLDGINDVADRNAAGLQRNAQRTRNLR